MLYSATAVIAVAYNVVQFTAVISLGDSVVQLYCCS